MQNNIERVDNFLSELFKCSVDLFPAPEQLDSPDYVYVVTKTATSFVNEPEPVPDQEPPSGKTN